jgi:hypothetical protein
MNADLIVAALAVPPEARVDQRVPKKLLVEQGAPTAMDKRHFHDGIEEIRWLAALKPSNIGVPEYRDGIRDYLEIAILSVALRPLAKHRRLTELIHRAIPYPVVLIALQGEEAVISLAHKRLAQNEAGQSVIDGELTLSPPLPNEGTRAPEDPTTAFLSSLSLAAQPRVHLCALYQGWMERLEAFQAARLTGAFVLAPTAEAADNRRAGLAEYQRIQREIAMLRVRAEKETQISRRVEINLDIRLLEGELALAAQNL